MLVQFFRRERERKTADDNIVIFSVFDIDTHTHTQRGESEIEMESLLFVLFARARAHNYVVCL